MNERTKQFFLQNKSLLEKPGRDELYKAAIHSKYVRTSDVTEALLEAKINPMLQVSQIYDMMYFNIYSVPTNITIPDNIKFIGNQAFTGTLIQQIDCNNVEYLDAQAFYRCLDLQEIKIPNVERIEQSAFYATGLLEVTFRKRSCVVEDFAFGECFNLKTINITKYTNISSRAFDGCDNVETINFNGTKHEFYEAHIGPAFRRDWYSKMIKSGAKIVCTDGEFRND